MARLYDSRIIEALKASDQPLGHKELAERIDPEAWQYIGVCASLLFREGVLGRMRVDHKYRYFVADQPPIDVGYTWSDQHGPMSVIAVAAGYAMCRRPGCYPFVRSLSELYDERAQRG